jgi:hypothetical protein
MWIACPNSERCGGGVEVELEAVSDGEAPFSRSTVVGEMVTGDGRHCDRGCALTEEQLAVVCHTAAEHDLLGIGAED